MPDMLVKLYDLPPLMPTLVAAAYHGCVIRRALSADQPPTVAWVRAGFPSWVVEVETAFSQLPVTCFIAMREQAILGFACYDATCPNFFGPTAVAEDQRGLGIGRALLLAALHAQREQGYAYSIIGGVGPADYYAKVVGAVAIEGSSPGIYANRVPG
ncbi:MAG: GNAT family N-acetyltransferase [Burkholderiales bacterium]